MKVEFAFECFLYNMMREGVVEKKLARIKEDVSMAFSNYFLAQTASSQGFERSTAPTGEITIASKDSKAPSVGLRFDRMPAPLDLKEAMIITVEVKNLPFSGSVERKLTVGLDRLQKETDPVLGQIYKPSFCYFNEEHSFNTFDQFLECYFPATDYKALSNISFWAPPMTEADMRPMSWGIVDEHS